MKNQAFNPFLPSYEYIPDAEPYVFGDRLYIYGSHDQFDGPAYCYNDYVCWSAPTDDLSNWHYEGIIYKKIQDPKYKDGNCMYAPDICVGPDGRYYLYYTLDRIGIMSVAVGDTPIGPFAFYGYVKRPNGEIIGESLDDLYQFDPGMFIDDDGRIFLYTGFAPEPNSTLHSSKGRPVNAFGSFYFELEPDMLTVKQNQPVPLIPTPGASAGTGFEGHEFFEASSMRKIHGKYYFVYSSINSHELCYAISDRPDGGFVYGGTIVSIADVFLDGRETKDALNYMGNTHGGMVQVKGQWYIFYHRQTNLHQYSRQACAEKITIEPDGSIKQVEVTSCGLNNGPLRGKGRYEARIACNLISSEGCTFYAFHHKQSQGVHPFFTQDGEDREDNPDQYITNFNNGCIAGFKYFAFDGDEHNITINIRGEQFGQVMVFTEIGGDPIATIDITSSNQWRDYTAPLTINKGTHALYFTFTGQGNFDFRHFEIV